MPIPRNAILTSALSRRWRSQFRSDELFTEIKYVLEIFCEPYMSLFKVSMMLHTHSFVALLSPILSTCYISAENRRTSQLTYRITLSSRSTDSFTNPLTSSPVILRSQLARSARIFRRQYRTMHGFTAQVPHMGKTGTCYSR